MKIPYEIRRHFTKANKRKLLNEMLSSMHDDKLRYELVDYTKEEIINNVWLSKTIEEVGGGTEFHGFKFFIERKQKHYRTGEYYIYRLRQTYIKLMADDSSRSGKIETYHVGLSIDNIIKGAMVYFMKDNTAIAISI